MGPNAKERLRQLPASSHLPVQLQLPSGSNPLLLGPSGGIRQTLSRPIRIGCTT
jgi:hypothetical protein